MNVRKSFIPDRSDLFTRVSPVRTLKAWEPFAECVAMNFELQNSDVGPDFPEWRMKWVYGVMLRTIGHVLEKVDTKTSDQHQDVIRSAWQRWKSDHGGNWIFWDFIEQERNSILKTYDFGVELGDGFLWHTGIGQDGVQLMREATYWWRSELEDLEARL